jgi:thiol:disulfide interchange protein DsbD
MKINLRYLSIFLLIQACSSSPRIPICKPNEVTQDEYPTSEVAGDSPTLWAFNDYEEGIACAQRQNKPVFLAFTGFGARTRYFPDLVLQQEAIVKHLTTNFVPIILYVDDRKRIPKEEIQTENGPIVLRTVGNLNAYLQESMFKKSSQPYMVLMTWDGQLLVDPMGYEPNPEDYIKSFEEATEIYAQRIAFERD